MSTRSALIARLPRFIGTASGAAVPVIAAVSVLAPAAAQGATRTASSPVTGMELRVDGNRVTVAAGDTPSTAFLRSVDGKKVLVVCSAGTEDLTASVAAGADGFPDRPFDTGILGGAFQWPAASRSVTYELPRDVSESLDGCVIGRHPAIAASFPFTAAAESALAEEGDSQRLTVAHHAAKLIARRRPDRRFPRPEMLAAAVAASEPQLRVRAAVNLETARRRDVVYVIADGTDAKRVRLLYRPSFGDAVELTGRRRGMPHVHQHSDVPIAKSPPDARRRPADARS